MVDARATVESMRRSVTNAQSSIEQFRHTRDKAQLDDIRDCLNRIRQECADVIESVTEANTPCSELEKALKQQGGGQVLDRETHQAPHKGSLNLLAADPCRDRLAEPLNTPAALAVLIDCDQPEADP